MIDLTQALKEKYKPYDRDPNRIYVSEVYALLKGWDKREPDFQAMMRMWQGKWKHEMIQDLLTEYEHEVKFEIPYNDWLLVGKADCLDVKNDIGLEIKTKDIIKDKAKDWEITQTRIYATYFNVPFKIVQPVFTDSKLYLKVLETIKPNRNWLEKLLEKIDKKVGNNK